MATRAERTKAIETLDTAFGEARGIYFTDFRRIPVLKMTKLRSDFRQKGIKYIVLKNTLARKSLEKCSDAKKELIPFLKGHVGAALVPHEATAPSRIIRDFQKENQDLLSVKVAYVDGSLFGAKDVSRLADLPSREVLLSQLLSCLKAPVTNMAGSLAAVLVKFVRTLDAVKQQKESTPEVASTPTVESAPGAETTPAA